MLNLGHNKLYKLVHYLKIMKEIKILIRIDEENDRIGFFIDRDKGDEESLSENLKLISALDLLKKQQTEKIEKKGGWKIEH